MNFAKQRDKNERAIIDALTAAGCAVQPLNQAGVPDLLVSYRGVLHLVEVKNPDAKGGGKYNTGDGCLTATQTKWWEKWIAKGAIKPVVVRTAAEAVHAVTRLPIEHCTHNFRDGLCDRCGGAS